MAHYMLQASFTSEAWAKMVNEPQNREQAIRPTIEKLGGKLIGYWFAFGEYDAVVIVQMPDNVSVAAASLAAAAGGSVKSVKTTPLLSVEEGMQAMRKAGEAGYRAPR
ncbi:MAG TPA: GYD domain-containing protein [Burkholderiales bacterium]|nr:GYD domain-containing protein [Burkholderiales bacterium]